MIDIEIEKQLVDLAKKDLKSFEKLYELYVKKIYSYVAYMTGNCEETEDVVSEVFEKAMLNIDQFEYKGYTFGAWLYKIAKNKVYDRSKKKERKNVHVEDFTEFIGTDEYNPHKSNEDNELASNLMKAIEKLKGEQREVIYLRYIDQYSIREVSEILQKSEDSVKSLAKRGLSKLKELI